MIGPVLPTHSPANAARWLANTAARQGRATGVIAGVTIIAKANDTAEDILSRVMRIKAWQSRRPLAG